MKRIRIATAIVIVIGLVLAGVVVVDGPWGRESKVLAYPVGQGQSTPLSAGNPLWVTGVQVLNVDSEPAIVTILYYPRGGGEPIPSAHTRELAPGQSATWLRDPALPDGWVGSAVVQSDKKVRAVTNVIDANGSAGGSYNGVAKDNWSDDTGSSVNLPLVKGNWYDATTTIYVQNAGDVNTYVSISYKQSPSQGGGAYNYSDSQALAPGYSKAYRVSQVSGVPSEFLGSAVVSNSANQPLAVTYDEIESAASNLLTGNAFKSGTSSTELYVPMVKKNWYSAKTGISVQNVGTSTTRLRVVYTSSTNGQRYTSTYQAGQMLQPDEMAVYLNDPILPASFLGSAKITSLDGQPIVAVANELSSELGPIQASTTSTFLGDSTTTRIVVPLVKKYWYGAVTGIQVQNVGSSSTRLRVKYTRTSGETYTGTQGAGEYLAAGASKTLLRDPVLPGTAGNDYGFVGSAEIVSLDGQPIVAIVNELDTTGRTDLFSGYGLSLPPN